LTQTIQTQSQSSDFTTSSTTFVDVTSFTLTLANRSGGKYFCDCDINSNNDGANINDFRFVEAASNKNRIRKENATASASQDTGLSITGDLDGQVLKVQMLVDAGTGRCGGTDAEGHSRMEILELS